ncbi:hypothetical protein [Mesorhizobium sp. A556]
MILSPTPFLGWSSVYRGEVKYIAFGRSNSILSPTYYDDAGFRVSSDGRKWFRYGVAGDLARYLGNFSATIMKRTRHCLVLGGRIRLPNGSTEAGLFVSDLDDGVTWKRKRTLADQGPSQSRGYYVAITDNANMIAAAIPDGAIAYTTDFENWAGLASIGVTLPNIVGQIAATDSRILASLGKSMRQSVTPPGPWSSGTAPFPSTNLQDFHGEDIFCAVDLTSLRTAPATGSPWTTRAIPASTDLSTVMYGDSRWLVGDRTGHLITSTTGITAWSSVTGGYGGDANIDAWLFDGDQWLMFWGADSLSYGSYDAMEPLTGIGLAGERTAGAAYIGT